MKLLYYELKKLLGCRLLWMLLALCVILNGMLCYAFTVPDEAYPYLLEIERDYRRDPDGLYLYYEELNEQSTEHQLLVQAYFKGELAEEPIYIRPCTYSGKAHLDDQTLIGRFWRQLRRDEFYHRELDAVIRRAKAQQSEVMFSHALYGEDGFAYQKQGLIAQTYTDIDLNTSIAAEAAYGWDQLFLFDTQNIFLLLLAAAGAVAVLLPDTGSIAPILRTAKRGRKHTAAAKLGTLALFSLLSALLIPLSALLGVWLKCGALSSLSNSIAVFADYGMIPYCMSVGEYLAFFLLSKLLLTLTVTLLCALLCSVTRHITTGCASTLLLVAVGAIPYHLQDSDAARFLNPYGLSRFFELTHTFRCMNFFGYAVLLLPAALLLIAAVAMLGGIGFWLCYRPPSIGLFSMAALRRLCAHPTKKRKPCRKKSDALPLSLFWYELRRSVFSRKGLSLLFVLILLKIGTASTAYTPQKDYQSTLYADYMKDWSGPQSTEKQQAIEVEYQRVQAALGDFDRMRYAFLRGELDESIFSDYMKEYNYAADRAVSIGQIRDHAAYLNAQAEAGIDNGCFLYDLDWNTLFSAGTDLALILYTVLLFSGIFVGERDRQGRFSLPRAAKNGRERRFWCKILLTLTVSGAISLLFIGIDALWICTRLYLPHAEAPLVSLERFGGIEAQISIGGFLLLSALVRILAIMLIGLLSALIGVWLQHRIYAALIGLSVIFAPRIAAAFGAAPLRHFDIAGATSLTELLLRGGTWSNVWLFLLALLLLSGVLIPLARREFCK